MDKVTFIERIIFLYKNIGKMKNSIKINNNKGFKI
jgi:hypothetical protein